jgi:hypothetical protein
MQPHHLPEFFITHGLMANIIDFLSNGFTSITTSEQKEEQKSSKLLQGRNPSR